MTTRVQTTVHLDLVTRDQIEQLRARMTVGRIRPSFAEVVREAIEQGLVRLMAQTDGRAQS